MVYRSRLIKSGTGKDLFLFKKGIGPFTSNQWFRVSFYIPYDLDLTRHLQLGCESKRFFVLVSSRHNVVIDLYLGSDFTL